jgi:Tol biopolymer transport system component
VFQEDEALPYREIYRNWSWSPDSSHVCFKGRRRPLADRGPTTEEIAIVSVVGDPRLRVRCEAANVSEDIAWHPDGRRIVIVKAGQLYEFDPGANDPPRPVPGLPAGRTICGMCWSPDGEILVFSSCRPHIPAGLRIELIEVPDTF